MNVEKAQREKPASESEEGLENESSEPALIAIEQDMQRLALDSVKTDLLLKELPGDDVVVKAATERSKNIRERINTVLQRALLLLSLSVTSDVVHAQEDVSTESENTRPHVALEYNNPQRVASNDARTYESFLRAKIKEYQSFTELVDLNEVTDVENAEETVLSGRSLDKEQAELIKRIYSKKRSETYLESLQTERDDIAGYAQQNREAYKEADHARQWLADLIHSDEYIKRARAEGLSDEEIQERQRRSLQDNIQFIDKFYEDNIGGYYLPAGSEMYPESEHDQIRIVREMMVVPGVVVHENTHHNTRGNEGLSERAKNLYKEASRDRDELLRGSRERVSVDYLLDPTELDARKKSFENQLEKLTNWRYGQPFTLETLMQARKLNAEGKFSHDVGQFLMVIKSEYFERIMNELADTEDSSQVENIV